MSRSVELAAISKLNLLGTRFIAKRIRVAVESALVEDSVEIDFTGVEVTQSFIDELLGPLLLRNGPRLLDRLAFRGCSDAAQAVISFVVSGRLLDYSTLRTFRFRHLRIHTSPSIKS
jgi:hypothetical protein